MDTAISLLVPGEERNSWGRNLVGAGCDNKAEEDSMNSRGESSDSSCADQMHLAERELSAFVRAVTQLYGSEEAKLAAEDWLDESELMDSPPLLTDRSWRAVTIAASARLANQLSIASRRTNIVCPQQEADIGNTIVESFLLHTSGVMLLSGPIASELRSERKRINDDPR